MMSLDDYDFFLPDELIAQNPANERSASRLLHVERKSGSRRDRVFRDIVELLQPGDVLVVNNTRVRPARLLGEKESGGRCEAFLLRRAPGDAEVWHCLIRASKSPRPGSRLFFPGGISATLLDSGGADGIRSLQFFGSDDFSAAIEAIGHIPLPPYIRRHDATIDRERYQTVYAAETGAVAAPTAGLHFTPQILAQLQERGVDVVPLTLHVGIGTFAPVRTSNLDEHRMHSELYDIPAATAETIRAAKTAGRRVVAVGTTTTRALEAAATGGTLRSGAGETDIFITPGYSFRMVDALITNFHLPRSTLLVLVSAFAGRELILDAYRHAVAARYRFFSYGDCMFLE